MTDHQMPGFEDEEKISQEAAENKKAVVDEALKSLSLKNKVSPNNKSKEQENYVSQSGFVKTPIIRGWYEILPLINIIKEKSLDCFIMGGYVRYMASKHIDPAPAGDVDIYFKTEESFNKFKEILDIDLKVKHENDISVTYYKPGGHDNKFFGCPIIQLIKPINKGAIVATGEMQDILDAFDFTVIRGGVCSFDPPTALVDADFHHDESLKKVLRIKNIHCPISSTMRMMKYAKKGYWAPPMNILPLFLDWGQRDRDYKDKLIEFLKSANEGRGLTEEEVNELEALLNVD